jgi:3-phenylpropionate/trans-cinnamate dioxygenase ferredoxin reductase subunit
VPLQSVCSDDAGTDRDRWPGHAGFQLAASLRQSGFGERIVLINDEGHLPYQRPPLSRLISRAPADRQPDVPAGQVLSRPEHHRSPTALRRSSRRPQGRACSGASLDYGHLVPATGARNRLLDLPNANLEDVRYLHPRRKQIAAAADRVERRMSS